MNEQILKDLMSQVNGSTFISIDTITDVKLTGGKKNEFQGRVTKRTTGSVVMVFQNKTTNAYENMVKRRLEQEGKAPESFELSPRQWGVRIENTPFVTHNDQLYLEVIFLKAGKSEILVDGQQFDGVVPGMAESSEGEQGGLENKVIIRTFKTSSIKAITINKQRYEDRS